MSARKFTPDASRHLLATIISVCVLTCRFASAADGNLDPTFGSGGKVVTDIGTNSNDTLLKIVTQADGKIIATGFTRTNSSVPQFALVRYNVDGTLDSSFGSGGKVVTVIAANTREIASDLLVLPDGKILVAGSIDKPSSVDSSFALLRYNSDGTLDTTFGTGGLVKPNVGTYLDSIGSIALQPDGKIVAAGNTAIPRPPGEQRNSNIALVRYNADGSLDLSFGTNGVTVSDFGPVDNYFADDATKVLLQPDGKIIVAGDSDGSGYFDFLIARYNADGSLDRSFGNGGFTKTDVGHGFEDGASDAVMQPDGKIILAGWANRSDAANNDFALLRYNNDGTLDPTFGDGGKVVFVLNNLADEELTSVLLQPDGKILALGDSNSQSGLLVFRFEANGALDSTFGTNGMTRVTFASSIQSEAIAFQNGKLIAAGYTPIYNTSDFALARLEIGAPPAPVVVSRKTHGASGVFDLPLPLSGTPAIEPRGGSNCQIVFTFPAPVTIEHAAVAPASQGTANMEGPAAMSSDGKTAILSLTNVSNAQTITITLNGVNDGSSTRDFSVAMTMLVGDTNGDGAVNSSDALQTRNFSGEITDARNWRCDVNGDGIINSADALIVRSHSGSGVSERESR